MGGRGACVRPGWASKGDTRLCLVVAVRGQHETPVLRSVAHRADQLAGRSGARRNRSRTPEPYMNTAIPTVKIFPGGTPEQAEAAYKAWWNQQQGIELLAKPELRQAGTGWLVTIRYRSAPSN